MYSPSFLTASLYVAIGGAVGSWLRFVVGLLFGKALGPVNVNAFPWSTLTVNVMGSFVMGALVGWLARNGAGSSFASEGMRLFLAVGLLGGFTTFSAFSLEIFTIIQRGQTVLAFAYVGLSLLAGLAAMAGGLALMRTIV